MDENESEQPSAAEQPPAAEQSAEQPAEQPAGKAESDWQRRRRLAAVFGDVLPDTTGDERGESSGTPDEWYRSQRPPHHGG